MHTLKQCWLPHWGIDVLAIVQLTNFHCAQKIGHSPAIIHSPLGAWSSVGEKASRAILRWFNEQKF